MLGVHDADIGFEADAAPARPGPRCARELFSGEWMSERATEETLPFAARVTQRLSWGWAGTPAMVATRSFAHTVCGE
jgi:hypothetical protein